MQDTAELDEWVKVSRNAQLGFALLATFPKLHHIVERTLSYTASLNLTIKGPFDALISKVKEQKQEDTKLPDSCMAASFHARDMNEQEAIACALLPLSVDPP